MSLKPLAKDIWIYTTKQKFLGVEMGTRMTVVKRSDGGLWVYSPVSLTSELKNSLDALGEVKEVICPNRFHHLYAKDYVDAYPQAKLYGAKGLQAKRNDLQFDAELDESSVESWKDDLECVFIYGMPKMNEVVFLHKPSSTLIVTDFICNFKKSQGLFSNLVLKLDGAYGKAAFPLTLRLMMKNKALFRQSVNRVLSWDFDRVVMCHGEVMEQSAKKQLQDAMLFCLS